MEKGINSEVVMDWKPQKGFIPSNQEKKKSPKKSGQI